MNHRVVDWEDCSGEQRLCGVDWIRRPTTVEDNNHNAVASINNNNNKAKMATPAAWTLA